MQTWIGFNFCQECLVLLSISFPPISTALSQVLTRQVWVRCMPGDGIEFVVAHDSLCRSCFDHAAYRHHAFDLLRAFVNEVAHKDRGPIWMPVGTISVPIPHMGEQCM